MKKKRGWQSAKNLKFGIVVSRFNEPICDNLLRHCLGGLIACGALAKNIRVCRVPGAFEIPWAAQRFARSKKIDVVICLGCIIKGKTPHFEHISREVSHGISRIALDCDVPVIFGVLTAGSEKQALERSGSKKSLNRGYEAALAAVEMAAIRKSGI